MSGFIVALQLWDLAAVYFLHSFNKASELTKLEVISIVVLLLLSR